jgi:hypothetical protein
MAEPISARPNPKVARAPCHLRASLLIRVHLRFPFFFAVKRGDCRIAPLARIGWSGFARRC